MNSLFRKRIYIFIKEVGMSLFAYLLIAFFWIWIISDFIFDSFQSVIGSAVIAFVLPIIGSIQGYKEYKIQFRIYECREIGRNAGKIGRPPNFFEKLGMQLDLADEIAIMQGWDIGREEFNALSEEEQSVLYELNRQDGF